MGRLPALVFVVVVVVCFGCDQMHPPARLDGWEFSGVEVSGPNAAAIESLTVEALLNLGALMNSEACAKVVVKEDKVVVGEDVKGFVVLQIEEAGVATQMVTYGLGGEPPVIKEIEFGIEWGMDLKWVIEILVDDLAESKLRRKR